MVRCGCSGISTPAGSKAIQVVRPRLQHLTALIEESRPVVSSAKGVADGVTKLHLDDLCSKVEALNQKCPGRCSETVYRYCISQDPQSVIDRRVRQGLSTSTLPRRRQLRQADVR